MRSRYNQLTHIRKEYRTEEEKEELRNLPKKLKSINETIRKAKIRNHRIDMSISDEAGKVLEAEAKKRGISKTKMAKMIVEEWSKSQNDDLS